MKTLSQLRAEQQAAGLTPPPPPDHGEGPTGMFGSYGQDGPPANNAGIRGVAGRGFCKIVGGEGDAFLRVEGQSVHPDFHPNLKKVS